MNRVQLRGQAGTVVASDSRQLFQAGGFPFPFAQDLLIPRCGIFSLPPFAGAEEVGIGRTDAHVAIRLGSWTFAFLIDAEGRFPDVASIVPRPSPTATRLRLDADDAQRFLDSLARRIKGPAAKELAVTLDLVGSPCLRFEIEGRVSEVNLANSEFAGAPLRICLKLPQFLRALELRFLEFEIRDPEKPIVARDGERLYLAMPLSPKGVLLPRSEGAPAEVTPSRRTLAPVEKPAKQTIAMPTSGSEPVRSGDRFDVLGEAEGLRDGLFKVAAHAGRILQFLREVSMQQNLPHLVRSSLLALTDLTTHGAKP